MFLQYIKFYFGPVAYMDSVDEMVPPVTFILTQITKIEQSFWSNFDASYVIEQHTGERQPVIEFEIHPEAWMIAKIASFVELLEYENTETFKTLFNEMMEHQFEIWVKDGMASEHTPPFLVTRVGDDYFSDLDSWSRYLTQESIFNETSSTDAVGGGVLYVMIDGVPRTFCNDTVCSLYFCFKTILNHTEHCCLHTRICSGDGKRLKWLAARYVVYLQCSCHSFPLCSYYSDGLRFRCPITWWISWPRGSGCRAFDDVQQCAMWWG